MERRQFHEACAEHCSLKRGSNVLKEDKETKCSAEIPLEAGEHDWLVKVTTGHWTCQLHGLLLKGKNLAGKRDFLSGFTALHWAARSGDCEMARQLMEMAKKAGSCLDANAESYGGYTPLHIAATHGREDAAAILVRNYQAKVDLRECSRRKPLQYLNNESPATLQQLLNKPDSSSAAAASRSKMTNVKAAVLSPTSRFLGVIKGLKRSVSSLSGSAGGRKTSKATGIFSSLSKEVKQAQEEAKTRGIETCV
ncbi:cytochrome b-245 light chain [Platysternon megacephalum]|uniref:Cytochrome b-245 light chain n=1 Tax=Platysternon megacephalum TaxID=55544 RepID=A0A4D9DS59_9SAUR|nr:cytochrome b-245 light chain [Platysternon megacephalum]